jgi:hypothetical protein
MNVYTLRAAAYKLGLSHETIRKRLQTLKAQGLALVKLKLDKCQEWEVIPEEALPMLAERAADTEINQSSESEDWGA